VPERWWRCPAVVVAHNGSTLDGFSQERPPLHEYLRHLLYKELRPQADVVERILKVLSLRLAGG
jgi:hypothetical protein